MNKQRRPFADHEKVALLNRPLIAKVPASDLCHELDIYANQFRLAQGLLRELPPRLRQRRVRTPLDKAKCACFLALAESRSGRLEDSKRHWDMAHKFGPNCPALPRVAEELPFAS